jgi:hypothetical protein
MEDVLLHNSARLHTGLQTVEVITELHWTLLPHPYHRAWIWPHVILRPLLPIEEYLSQMKVMSNGEDINKVLNCRQLALVFLCIYCQ